MQIAYAVLECLIRALRRCSKLCECQSLTIPKASASIETNIFWIGFCPSKIASTCKYKLARHEHTNKALKGYQSLCMCCTNNWATTTDNEDRLTKHSQDQHHPHILRSVQHYERHWGRPKYRQQEGYPIKVTQYINHQGYNGLRVNGV